MTDKEAKIILESILFISGEPLKIESIGKILELEKGDVERIVKDLVSEYQLKDSGIIVAEVAEGVQMVTNPVSAPWVKKMLATSVPTRLSRQSLETLAIVAYKQPIIKAEVESIRGVGSDGVLKTLLERRLIKILGRKEAPGRPLMYSTTKEFLQYFGLKDLAELPTLKEFQEIDDIGTLPFTEPPVNPNGLGHGAGRTPSTVPNKLADKNKPAGPEVSGSPHSSDRQNGETEGHSLPEDSELINSQGPSAEPSDTGQADDAERHSEPQPAE